MFIDYREKLPSTLTICLLYNVKLLREKKKSSSNLSSFFYWVQCSLVMEDCYLLSGHHPVMRSVRCDDTASPEEIRRQFPSNGKFNFQEGIQVSMQILLISNSQKA